MSAAAPGLRRLTPVASLLLVAAAGAWVGVSVLVRHLGAMPGTLALGVASFALMWVLMMAAMMLPSATPFVSLYLRGLHDSRAFRVAGFALGYLLVWAAAGIPAYALARVAAMLVAGSRAGGTAAAVAIFAASGAYQLTPLKYRCLARCRSPLGFVFRYGGYRGRTRDLRIGIVHGAFCVGCCWALMALLIAFGLMNVVAMIALALAVIVEKTSAHGLRVGQAIGVVALVLAVAVVFDPGLAPGLQSAAGSGTQRAT